MYFTWRQIRKYSIYPRNSPLIISLVYKHLIAHMFEFWWLKDTQSNTIIFDILTSKIKIILQQIFISCFLMLLATGYLYYEFHLFQKLLPEEVMYGLSKELLAKTQLNQTNWDCLQFCCSNSNILSRMTFAPQHSIKLSEVTNIWLTSCQRVFNIEILTDKQSPSLKPMIDGEVAILSNR